MGVDTNVSAAAVAIAIVALLIAVGQIAQQYFSTAEGFRRCQPPVMGVWAKHTRSKFMPSELRYQTIFSTPHLTFVGLRDVQNSKNSHHLIGCPQLNDDNKPFRPKGVFTKYFKPFNRSNARSDNQNSPKSFRATWLSLLEQIELYQNKAIKVIPIELTDEDEKLSDIEARPASKYSVKDLCEPSLPGTGSQMYCLSLPAARSMEYSWDFMPPEIVRPLATIALGDLLILGHRLGLDWEAVRPFQGVLQAQDDHGSSINSNNIRGFGVVATFIHDQGQDEVRSDTYTFSKSVNNTLMIPTTCADKLAFGIIPGDRKLGLDDVRASTNEQALDYISTCSRRARDALKASFQKGVVASTGFDQLLPIISPCLVLRGCQTNRVRAPNEWASKGILYLMEGYVVFRDHLKHLRNVVETSTQRLETIEWIVGPDRGLGETGPSQWFGEITANIGPWAGSHVPETYDSTKLSSTMALVHERCTQRLKIWSDDLSNDIQQLRKLVEADRVNNDAGIASETVRSTRSPIVELIRAHMSNAVGLDARVTEHLKQKRHVEMYQIAQLGAHWPDAKKWCQTMNFMLEDVDRIADEVIESLLGPLSMHRLQSKEKAGLPEMMKPIHEKIVCMWYTMIFRALVFNRSAFFDEPKRASSGGKPYNIIPAQWYGSQIPVFIG